MKEHSENLSETILQLSTIDDLKSALPKQMTEKLDEGDEGVNQALALLIGLAHFVPHPATFSRDAFNAVVAFDSKNGKLLDSKKAQIMCDVAIDAKFIQKADMERERYSVKEELQKAIIKILYID